ncbi:MAG TPA: hypothetical protein VLA94_04490 [Syntrophales bacterium]|nr:hypothetical protein [Syntrophales bacterium]
MEKAHEVTPLYPSLKSRRSIRLEVFFCQAKSGLFYRILRVRALQKNLGPERVCFFQHTFSGLQGIKFTGRDGLNLKIIKIYQTVKIISGPKNTGGMGIAQWGDIRPASEREGLCVMPAAQGARGLWDRGTGGRKCLTWFDGDVSSFR